MSSTLTPFLFQTRTLRSALRSPTFTTRIVSRSYAYQRRSRPNEDGAVPFDWTDMKPPEESRRPPPLDGKPGAAGKDGNPSTITPSEAEIFKGIFDEIAQGKMPRARARRVAPSDSAPAREGLDTSPRSMVEQARVSDFQEKVLARFPETLREAAHLALGLFELQTGAEVIDTETQDQRKERIKFEQAKAEEKARVDALMEACQSDVMLWKVMEAEVFSLPHKLGIASPQENREPAPKTRRRSKKSIASEEPGAAAAAAAAPKTEPDTEPGQGRTMDIHGSLYSHYLSAGLHLFDTKFRKPSAFAFHILPRVRALGLPSYVLGVSTPFYTSLATMHWDRFGDATSALDVLQEMVTNGLVPDDDSRALLGRIREHVLGCTWGVQGPFVAGMMEAPPYDAALMQRIDELDELAELAQKQAEDQG